MAKNTSVAAIKLSHRVESYGYQFTEDNIKANLARQAQDLAVFEIGKVFSKSEEIIQQDVLLLAKTGQQSPEQWSVNNQKVDFFTLKGDVETMLSGSGLAIEFSASSQAYLHPGRQARISLAGKTIGYLGQVHPSICQKMKIKQRMARVFMGS